MIIPRIFRRTLKTADQMTLSDRGGIIMLVHLNTGIFRGEHEKLSYIQPSWSFGSFIITKPYFKWNIPVITVKSFGFMTCMIDCDVL